MTINNSKEKTLNNVSEAKKDVLRIPLKEKMENIVMYIKRIEHLKAELSAATSVQSQLINAVLEPHDITGHDLIGVDIDNKEIILKKS